MKHLLIIICLLFSVTTYADDIDWENIKIGDHQVDAREIILDNLPFVAFDRDSAQRLLQMRVDFPKMELKLEKTAELLTGLNHEIRLLDKANLNLIEQSVQLVNGNIELQQALDDRDRWYKSPYFTFVCGLLIGAGGAITMFYIAK